MSVDAVNSNFPVSPEIVERNLQQLFSDYLNIEPRQIKIQIPKLETALAAIHCSPGDKNFAEYKFLSAVFNHEMHLALQTDFFNFTMKRLPFGKKPTALSENEKTAIKNEFPQVSELEDRLNNSIAAYRQAINGDFNLAKSIQSSDAMALLADLLYRKSFISPPDKKIELQKEADLLYVQLFSSKIISINA